MTLTCSLLTKIIPMWIHPDGEKINYNGFTVINPVFRYKDRFIVNQDGSLSINETKRSDSGLYICSSGSKNVTFHLLMTGKNIVTSNIRFCFILYRMTSPKYARLHLNESELSETEIYKTQRSL